MAYVDLKENQNSDKLKEARAIRLKLLRRLANFSRRSFATQFGLKEATLQNWEAPRHGGLTESGAQKVIECYNELGIYAGLNWLMYGIGDTPSKLAGSEKAKAQKHVASIAKDEIQFMKSIYPESMLYKVPDNTMDPIYPMGAFVMGAKVASHNVANFHNKVCICLTENGEMLLRQVRLTRDSGRYDLISLNAMTQVRHAHLYARKLTSIAPVFWIRYP